MRNRIVTAALFMAFFQLQALAQESRIVSCELITLAPAQNGNMPYEYVAQKKDIKVFFNKDATSGLGSMTYKTTTPTMRSGRKFDLEVTTTVHIAKGPKANAVTLEVFGMPSGSSDLVLHAKARSYAKGRTLEVDASGTATFAENDYLYSGPYTAKCVVKN